MQHGRLLLRQSSCLNFLWARPETSCLSKSGSMESVLCFAEEAHQYTGSDWQQSVRHNYIPATWSISASVFLVFFQGKLLIWPLQHPWKSPKQEYESSRFQLFKGIFEKLIFFLSLPLGRREPTGNSKFLPVSLIKQLFLSVLVSTVYTNLKRQMPISLATDITSRLSASEYQIIWKFKWLFWPQR